MAITIENLEFHSIKEFPHTMVMVVVVMVMVVKMMIQKRGLIEHMQYVIFDLFSQLVLHTAIVGGWL